MLSVVILFNEISIVYGPVATMFVTTGIEFPVVPESTVGKPNP
jgi:hypothetical protein